MVSNLIVWGRHFWKSDFPYRNEKFAAILQQYSGNIAANKFVCKKCLQESCRLLQLPAIFPQCYCNKICLQENCSKFAAMLQERICLPESCRNLFFYYLRNDYLQQLCKKSFFNNVRHVVMHQYFKHFKILHF